MRSVLAAALTASLSTAPALAATIAPASGALAPLPSARTGHRLRNARLTHCEIKADGVGVEGKAREIYLRKCTRV